MRYYCCFAFSVFSLIAISSSLTAQGLTPRLDLRESWMIQSSAQVSDQGAVVSISQFHPVKWYPTRVPSTVLAALLANDVYPDPYFGMNLRRVPGTSYPIGENFSNLPMPAESPFRLPWWYRREFTLPESYRGKTIWLHFNGINFRANIWLNGRQIADSKNVAGAFRTYEFNITDAAELGKTNVLAVEVSPPEPHDLAITWVDVNAAPPDKNMGIWQDVYVAASGPVALRFPDVVSRLELPSLEAAQLTVTAQLTNATNQPVKGTLRGRIGDVQFAQDVALGPQETMEVAFAPERFPQLNLRHPRVWWPAAHGRQELYELRMEFECNRQVSDSQSIRFGIRDVSSELNPQGHRVFKINGKDLLVRGAGWWSDMLLRFSPARQEAEIRYFRDMNLNVLRMDGKFEDENFLNLADQYGLLLMPGWCCCDHWERWKDWNDEDYTVAAESLKSQIRRFRTHPSVLTWLNGDDNPPPARAEEMYVKILEEAHWPNPFLSSATGKPAQLTGGTGLKMTGPYEYIPPVYWYADKTRGGAFGFITETSPGPAIPPLESLKKFLPKDHLWPIDEFWNYHTGGGPFRDLKVFTQALGARYGEATSIEDYARKAQMMTYEGQRAMFEAYGRNKYASTGILQEMLNQAWPSLIWQLYDYYLRPGGGYFGTKKGCEPLHIQYSYDDRSVVVVNSLFKPFRQMKARAVVYDLDLKERFSREVAVDAGADSSTRVFVIPEIEGLTTTYFVNLALLDSAGQAVSSNFYWLSTKPEVLDWEKSTWYYTPAKTYADFTALERLPQVALRVASRISHQEEEDTMHVVVSNPTPHLALAVHLRITKGRGGDEVLPILWDDNYFALLPGEKREIGGTYHHDDLRGEQPVVEVDGWNVTAN